MSSFQNGPTVRLARLKRRETKDGRIYFAGFLAGNKLLLFQDKAEPEFWNLLLQEPSEDERARWEQRKAETGGRTANTKATPAAPRTMQRRKPEDGQQVGDDSGRPFNDDIPFLAA